MNALRLHKGTVPGLEKPRQTRRLQHLSRQRASRSSLLQGLRTFFTADSYMYGPLLESPPPPPVHISSDSEPHTPDREQEEDGGLEDGSTRETENEKEGDTSSGKIGNGHDEAPGYQGFRSSKTLLSYQRMTRIERAVVPPAADGNGTPTSTAGVSTTISTMQVNANEGRVLLVDQDEETSSMTNSYGDEGHTMLDNEMACKVVQMLLSKMGGRYSTELGINVDAGDEEVERWFLAVALFHRHLPFEVLKKTFQRLASANIVSVSGMLHMEEDDIADILESAGYTTYKHRAAARLRKLASQLETQHKGKVSSLKLIEDPHELCRHISNLHGLTINTCNEFLRELRGVWPGAAAGYDRRTNRASMHLRIAESDRSEESIKSSVLNSHTSLKRIAEGADVDERDLEVALVKLGLAHERHYRECPGGTACNFFVSPDEPEN